MEEVVTKRPCPSCTKPVEIVRDEDGIVKSAICTTCCACWNVVEEDDFRLMVPDEADIALFVMPQGVSLRAATLLFRELIYHVPLPDLVEALKHVESYCRSMNPGETLVAEPRHGALALAFARRYEKARLGGTHD